MKPVSYKSFVFFIVLLVIISCSETAMDNEPIQENTTDQLHDTIPLDLKSVEAAMLEQYNAFGFNIFNTLVANDNEGDNVFISPTSIYYALSMAYIGADGTTSEEFRSLMGWGSTPDTTILASLQQLQYDLISSSEGVELTIANSVWTRGTFQPEDEFIMLNEAYLNAEVYALDFSLPTAADEMNGWIADKTNDKITHVISEISSEAMLYLINAIYFNATWQYEFADTSNYEAVFNLYDGAEKEVVYMHQQADLAYAYTDNFNAVKLPYSDSNYYMMVVAPKIGLTVADVASSLDTTSWNALQKRFTKTEVELALPKFKFKYGTRDISNELKSLGLVNAFSDTEANFSKLSNEYYVYISGVLHKSFIDVSEKGTEAAAVTVVEMVTDEAGSQVNFTVNHPFLFTICEAQTNTILFMGKVMEPSYE